MIWHAVRVDKHCETCFNGGAVQTPRDCNGVAIVWGTCPLIVDAVTVHCGRVPIWEGLAMKNRTKKRLEKLEARLESTYGEGRRNDARISNLERVVAATNHGLARRGHMSAEAFVKVLVDTVDGTAARPMTPELLEHLRDDGLFCSGSPFVGRASPVGFLTGPFDGVKWALGDTVTGSGPFGKVEE
jgi:hypothetical protein